MTNTTAASSAGRGLDAPVIPDATLPEFVLGQAHVRGSAAPPDSCGAAHVARPRGAPAYYLGRPAQVYLAAFGGRRLGSSSAVEEMPFDPDTMPSSGARGYGGRLRWMADGASS